MKINVTQHHINKGQRVASTQCPIALAMRDQCGTYVSVGPQEIHVYYPWKTETYTLPQEARDFIKDFDGEHFVQPITFEATYVSSI